MSNTTSSKKQKLNHQYEKRGEGITQLNTQNGKNNFENTQFENL